MRNSILWLAALLAALALVGSSAAQPPQRRGGPPGPFGGRGGPGGGLERAVDDLKLTEAKKGKADAAVRAYQDNRRKLAELADADLLLKMKEALSPEEFKKLKEATDGFRGGFAGFAGRGGRGLGVDDIVERILSFDKNKDGKVTKDELPERMQYLIEKGDTNKDGALDKDEIKKLAADLARDGSARGGDGRGGRGGPGGPGGRGGFGGFFAPRGLERAVDDLNLSGKKKETADAAVKAHQENVRKLTELARAELVLKMDEVLSEDEAKKFKAALDRQPGSGDRPAGRDGRPPSPPPATPGAGDLEKKLDQLQKDLDSLRREIRR